jgi:hypothetical protein
VLPSQMVCDAECTASAVRELVGLKRTEADIMSACRTMNCVNDDDTLDWEAFYEECSLHLVGVGTRPSIQYVTPWELMKFSTWEMSYIQCVTWTFCP